MNGDGYLKKSHINPNRLSVGFFQAESQLGCGEMQHVLSSTKQSSPSLVVDAGLGLVKALKSTLLASETVTVIGFHTRKGLEETGVTELGVHSETVGYKKTDTKS